jgi:CHASE2 domain-containing sensor protein
VSIDRLKAIWAKGWIGALLAAFLGFAVLWLPLGLPFTEGLVNLSYDLPFFFRRNVPVNGVKIIYMDEESHKQLGQKWREGWDRSLHAKLIDNLTRWHAKAIVFDVLFLTTTDPAVDAQLVEAVTKNGKVVLASIMAPDVHEGEVIAWKRATAFPLLNEAAVSGLVEESVKSKTVRQHCLDLVYGQPSMAWQAAKLALNKPPPDPFRERWINYYGPPGFIPNVSYVHALDSNFDGAAAFSNKVVFIGAKYDIGYTGGKGTDDFGTPYTVWTARKAPGVEINATTFLNLVRGDWLFRLSPWIEAPLFLLIGALAGFSLSVCRPIPAVAYAIAAALVIAFGAIVLVWQTRLWIPWLSIVGVQIPVALAWSLLGHTTRLHREKRSLEQALAMAHRGEVVEVSDVNGQPAPALASQRGTPRHRADVDPFFRKAFGSDQAVGVSDDDKPTPVISDHELLRCIGGGAYGKVWLARDLIGSFHAVKVVYRDNFKDSRPLEREFNGLKKFTPISRSHPGFVNVLHVGRNEEAGYIYYVMELGDDQVAAQKIDPQKYSAKTLANELQRRKSFPLSECLDLMIHLAGTLDYLHQQNLIHRDIKPSNLIFVNGICKFADIGLVTDIATDGRDVTYLGTPGRIPPEGPGAPTSDVYSLGKVLYEMAFGLDLERFPELPTAVIEGATSDALLALNRIIMKACENDPRQRYQSAAAFRADLIELQRNQPCAAKV